MAQERRSAILHGFLEGKYHIVVGTGVLARGLDLVNVQQASPGKGPFTLVLQISGVMCRDFYVLFLVSNQVFIFDMPFSVREFIHQVGTIDS